jgi:hypothetical protein
MTDVPRASERALLPGCPGARFAVNVSLFTVASSAIVYATAVPCLADPQRYRQPVVSHATITLGAGPPHAATFRRKSSQVLRPPRGPSSAQRPRRHSAIRKAQHQPITFYLRRILVAGSAAIEELNAWSQARRTGCPSGAPGFRLPASGFRTEQVGRLIKRSHEGACSSAQLRASSTLLC